MMALLTVAGRDTMLKDIAVIMTGGDGDSFAMNAGVKLARHFDGQLRPLQVVELPAPAFSTYAILSDPHTQTLHEQLRRDASTAAERAQSELDAAHVDTHRVRIVEALYAHAWAIAARECYCTDLIVIGKHQQMDAGKWQLQNISGLLFQTGRPMLIVSPASELSMPIKKILIAWRPTREASRAIHDAMPLLQKAESVEIVVYDDDADQDARHRRRVLTDHLWHHGINARCVAIDSRGVDIASLILSHSDNIGADLVIAGGYGHSRFVEWVLGGVTRGLLAEAKVPILLSH
jgi:nucleotide-binding universal stress UspA family protein